MTLSRWKLMAGVLGLSMCGLAALAEPACRTVGFTRRADDPNPTPAPEPASPVDAAKPLPLPVTPPPAVDVPPPIIPPLAEETKAAPPPEPKSGEVVKLPPVNNPSTPPAVDPKLLEKVAEIQNPPTPLPTLPEKKAEPTKADPLPPPLPLVGKGDTPPAPTGLPIPGPTTPPVPSPTPAPALVPPTPAPLPTPGSALPPFSESRPPADPPAVQVKAETSPEPVKPVGKKLKVMLHLSDEKPWFEVRDGDELVLKVTADAVSLEAAASGGRTPSTLTANGVVSFRTLGGTGTCDELRVVPGTGEVIVTGKVTVTSNWGKSETTATADKMTFRLGGDAKK